MTDNSLLTEKHKQTFNHPPNYRANTQAAFFEMTRAAEAYFNTRRTPESQLAFLLAYSYCKTDGRIFDARLYPIEIIKAAIIRYRRLSRLQQQVGDKKITKLKVKLNELTQKHKPKIIELLGRKKCGTQEFRQLDYLAKELAAKQTGPELLFSTLVERCLDRNWLLPTYTQLTAIINSNYSAESERVLLLVGQNITKEDASEILEMSRKDGELGLNKLRSIEQSRKPKAFRESGKLLLNLKSVVNRYKPIIEAINLNDQAIAYHAHWVQSVGNRQIAQLQDWRDQFVRILSFIMYNYQERQDAMMVGFLSNIRSDRRKYLNLSRERFFQKNSQSMQAIKKSAEGQRSVFESAQEVRDVLVDESMVLSQRVQIAINQLDQLLEKEKPDALQRADLLDEIYQTPNTDKPMYKEMMADIKAIVDRYRKPLMALEFDVKNEVPQLFSAVIAFQNEREIGNKFLPAKKRKIWSELGENAYLLQMMLFEEIAKAIQSGKLSLLHTFNYKRLQRLFIPDSRWKDEKNTILKALNLYRFKDFKKFKRARSKALEKQFKSINSFLYHAENHDLHYTAKGRPSVKVRRKGEVSYPQTISDFLYDVIGTPVTEILQDVHDATGFFNEFTHSTNKHASRRVSTTTLRAAIIAQGSNLGAHSLYKRSRGVKETPLLDAIKFRLTPENLKAANDVLNKTIDNLALSKLFQVQEGLIHSSSDGQKWMVKDDSLIAQKSFKYFGQDSGLTRYMYVDDRNRVFSSRIFMPTKHDSTYVIDGLAQNVSEIPRVHSTDSHGVSEPVFACMSLMGVDFCPRIKDLKDKTLHSDKPSSYYKSMGYKIFPTSKVSWSDLESQWDEVLRMMASILSGHCLASQVFNRINSYSGDHPLYKALKVLGRIEKTNFILRYQGNSSLRDRIQKQLNLGEQSNRFAKAICWADSRELKGQTTSEFERAMACTQLIQNSVVLWNYMYVTKRLLDFKPDERADLVSKLASGQMMAWEHVNFTGIFHFTSRSMPSQGFNLSELTAVKFKTLGSPNPMSDWPDDLDEEVTLRDILPEYSY